MEKLKPCPFCSGSAYTDQSEEGLYFWCSCIRCGAKTEKYRIIEEAIEAWNRRV